MILDTGIAHLDDRIDGLHLANVDPRREALIRMSSDPSVESVLCSPWRKSGGQVKGPFTVI